MSTFFPSRYATSPTLFTSAFLTSTSSNNNPPLPGNLFWTIASLIDTILPSSLFGFSGAVSVLFSPGFSGVGSILLPSGFSGFVSVLFPLGGVTFPPTFSAIALTSSIVLAVFNSALNFNLSSCSLLEAKINLLTFVFSLPIIAALVFSVKSEIAVSNCSLVAFGFLSIFSASVLAKIHALFAGWFPSLAMYPFSVLSSLLTTFSSSPRILLKSSFGLSSFFNSSKSIES